LYLALKPKLAVPVRAGLAAYAPAGEVIQPPPGHEPRAGVVDHHVLERLYVSAVVVVDERRDGVDPGRRVRAVARPTPRGWGR